MQRFTPIRPAAASLAVACLVCSPAHAQTQAPPGPGDGQQGYGQQGYGQQGYGQQGYGQRREAPSSASESYEHEGARWRYGRGRYQRVPQWERPPFPPAYPAPTSIDPETATDAHEDEPSGFAFDVAMGTTFPLDLGPQVTLEIPARILFQLELGWLPGGYSSAIVGLIETFGKERALLGPAIESSLADSLVVRTSLGWRPFSDYGFEIYGGYTHISVGGTVTAEVIDRVVDGPLGDRVETEVTTDPEVDVALHNFHLALGWRFLALDDHLVLRILLGYTQTVASSSSLAIADSPELATEVEPVFDEGLDEIVTSDVKLPLLGFTAGYRF